jgi:hypothetical protein
LRHRRLTSIQSSYRAQVSLAVRRLVERLIVADYYPLFAAVGSIVGAIIILRVFFTFWRPVDRKFSGDLLDVTKDIQIAELKDALVNVFFKSGSTIANVVLVGYCSTHHDAPYDFKQLLILKDKSGKLYYVRISEIQYLEQVIEQQ